MAFLDTTYKKKSAILTSIILALFILALFIFGLRYYEPPIEYGMAINFGTTDFGKGKTKTRAIPKTEPVKTKVKQSIEPLKIKKQNTVKEKVITQNKIDAPVITKKTIKKSKKRTPKKKKIVKKKTPPQPKPDKSTTDILSKLINGPKNKGKGKTGEGTDTRLGNKGQKDGDLNAKNYYGKGSNGGGGNYNLGNRKPISTPKPIYDCNEEGRVVVSIEVNKNGRVISANVGVKGSTTSAPCLLRRAKAAALKTTWQADYSAPNKQIGSIIYNFSLTN